MVLTNDIDYDNRVINEAITLSKKFQVKVLSRYFPHPGLLKKGPFEVKRINYQRIKFYQLNIFSSLFSLMIATYRENPDIYHAHDLDGLLCAYPAALLKRKILIYDSHELWSDIFPFSNLRGIKWLLRPLERFFMLKVKAGITVNQTIATFLEKRYRKKFLVLHNRPDLRYEISSKINIKKLYPKKKIILHLGFIDEGRGLEEIIETAKSLPKNYLLVFLGEGKLQSQIRQIIDNKGLKDKVKILPRVKPEEITSTIRGVDLGLALTQKISLSYYYSSPNKLPQYIAAGVPILGSNFPEFKKIILNNKIGEVVNPSKPLLIAEKIIRLTTLEKQKVYRKNLVGLAKSKYNWDVEEKKLLKFYEDIVNP